MISITVPVRQVINATPRTRLILIDVETGENKNVDHGQRAIPNPTTEQPLRDAKSASESSQVRAQVQDSKPRDRDVQLFQLQWSEDGKNAVLMGRSADNKDRWVLLLDSTTGKTKVLSTVHDDA